MLTPWKESYDQPRQHIQKQRHYFANKGPSSQDYGFSSGHVWMWELDYKESWVLKNWCFQTVVSEKTLESPLDCRRSKQSILKEISPGCSLEGLMLKLKLLNFGHLMLRADSFEKTWCWERLRARWEGDERGWDGWMASTTQCTWVSVDSGSWWWTGRPGLLRFMGLQRVGHNWATELNWTECWSLTASTFRISNSSGGIPSPPLALFIVMLIVNWNIIIWSCLSFFPSQDAISFWWALFVPSVLQQKGRGGRSLGSFPGGSFVRNPPANAGDIGDAD